VADTPEKSGDETPPPAETAPLTEDALSGATYEVEELGTIQLTDGQYRNQYGEGATQVDLVGLEAAALGDLNGDGLDDAAVILWWQSGGTGTFIYLAAVVNEGGAPRQAGIAQLGDRVRIEALSIDDGEIVIDAIAHGPDDPMCCPTQIVRSGYALEGGALVEVSSEVIGAVEEKSGAEIPPELLGKVWQWQEYLDTAGLDNITVEDPAKYTLEFLPEGSYQVVADCNMSSGRYVVEGVSLILELGPTTLAECGPDSLYSRYLDRLSHVATFVLQDGRLFLNLKMDSGDMVFSSVEEKSGAAIPPELLGRVWQWQEYLDTAGLNNITVEDPAKYTLEYLPDGTYQVVADCNLSTGRYVVEGGSLILEPGPTTLAECGPESLYSQFLRRLGDVATFVLEDGRLFLNLKMDAGDMVFSSEASPTSG
jgi:heat shock protein HslJ